jgi:plastocyanin
LNGTAASSRRAAVPFIELPVQRLLLVLALAASSTRTTCEFRSGTGVDGFVSGGDSRVVTVGNNYFSPAAITVPRGTTVTWQWAPDASSHSVTFDDGESSAVRDAGSFSRTFDFTGTYTYYCTVHGRAVMSGAVEVQ